MPSSTEWYGPTTRSPPPHSYTTRPSPSRTPAPSRRENFRLDIRAPSRRRTIRSPAATARGPIILQSLLAAAVRCTEVFGRPGVEPAARVLDGTWFLGGGGPVHQSHKEPKPGRRRPRPAEMHAQRPDSDREDGHRDRPADSLEPVAYQGTHRQGHGQANRVPAEHARRPAHGGPQQAQDESAANANPAIAGRPPHLQYV